MNATQEEANKMLTQDSKSEFETTNWMSINQPVQPIGHWPVHPCVVHNWRFVTIPDPREKNCALTANDVYFAAISSLSLRVLEVFVE